MKIALSMMAQRFTSVLAWVAIVVIMSVAGTTAHSAGLPENDKEEKEANFFIGSLFSTNQQNVNGVLSYLGDKDLSSLTLDRLRLCLNRAVSESSNMRIDLANGIADILRKQKQLPSDSIIPWLQTSLLDKRYRPIFSAFSSIFPESALEQAIGKLERNQRMKIVAMFEECEPSEFCYYKGPGYARLIGMFGNDAACLTNVLQRAKEYTRTHPEVLIPFGSNHVVVPIQAALENISNDWRPGSEGYERHEKRRRIEMGYEWENVNEALEKFTEKIAKSGIEAVWILPLNRAEDATSIFSSYGPQRFSVMRRTILWNNAAAKVYGAKMPSDAQMPSDARIIEPSANAIEQWNGQLRKAGFAEGFSQAVLYEFWKDITERHHLIIR